MSSAHAPQAGTPRAAAGERIALISLAAGALATVLAVLPYRAFDLDRFAGPKELALHTTALVAGTMLLAGTRRLALTATDLALAAWLALSALSALFAGNHWLGLRAFTISASGAVVFWSARRLAAAGLANVLARTLAAVVVLGALTALAQAYGVKMEFASLNRAPGGTFGNRNFMAHLTAIGLPLLIWCIADARSRFGRVFWTGALTVCSAALVLSRTRAAWLALLVWGALALLAVRGSALADAPFARRRAGLALAGAVLGVVLALVLPNRLDWRSDNPYLESVVSVVNYREGSGRGRVRQYANSTRMAAAHPVLGVGPGNWPVAYPRYAPGNDPSLLEGTGTTANPWPSSDWIAALSERGVPAALALAALVVSLLLGALRARRDASRPVAERVAAMAGGGVLVVAALEGGFDAVLLLSAPALVTWGAAGALIPGGRVLREVALGRGTRTALLVLTIAASLSGVLTSAGRVAAMRLYGQGTTAALEEAAARDPGSYRVRMRAAELYAARGRCENARRHAVAAGKLFPNAAAPKRVAAQCR